jgi:LSD1 subclass zinc finger protein
LTEAAEINFANAVSVNCGSCRTVLDFMGVGRRIPNALKNTIADS